MPKIMVVNGPNINLLGRREPEIYGTDSLDQLNRRLDKLATELGLTLVFFQSNHEGEIVDFLHEEGFKADGLIVNPGAFTHYSYALRDAIVAVGVEAVEVHLSNVYKREEFRHRSVIADICQGRVVGFGYYGYAMALSYFADTSPKE